MLVRTTEFLRNHPDIWDDGNFAFGQGANSKGSVDVGVIECFFGNSYVTASLSQAGSHQICLARCERPLMEVSKPDGQRALIQLLKNDLRMFSCHQVDPSVLGDLVALFFDEMGDCKVFSNTSIGDAGEGSDCLGSWTPVTLCTRDTFLCAVNKDWLAFWLYSDDE